jgi:hypothetical protein
MSNTIQLKYVNKGIGVNFLNDKEERHYQEIIESLKSQLPTQIALGVADVKWDLDNMRLGHSNPVANRLLQHITLQLAS